MCLQNSTPLQQLRSHLCPLQGYSRAHAAPWDPPRSSSWCFAAVEKVISYLLSFLRHISTTAAWMYHCYKWLHIPCSTLLAMWEHCHAEKLYVFLYKLCGSYIFWTIGLKKNYIYVYTYIYIYSTTAKILPSNSIIVVLQWDKYFLCWAVKFISFCKSSLPIKVSKIKIIEYTSVLYC